MKYATLLHIVTLLPLVIGSSDPVYAISTEYNSVSAGSDHNCVLDDNGVTCWGRSDYVQTNMSTPSFWFYRPNLSDQTVSYVRGEEITPERLSNTGRGYINTCEVTSGALPTGLILSVASDNETCEITGTPTVVTTTTISVTATNSYGSDTAAITLEITAQPIPNLSTPSELQTLLLNQSITPIELTNTGGLVTGCSVIAGTLPGGLGLGVTSDNTTCQITGTPTESISSTSITVQAINESGNDTADLDIEVRGPPNISDQSVGYLIGEEITPERLSNTGSGYINTCEVTSGTLPTGLILSVTSDNETCEITGTPTVVTTTTISVTAVNSYGSDTAAIDIEVYGPPNLSDQTASYIRGEEITPVRLSNTGSGYINTCEVTSGTLPTGLILSVTSDNETCEITGTPSVVTTNTISVKATNSYGNDTAAITLGITAQPIPNLSAPSELQTLILNQSITPIVLSNTGGLVTGCSVIAGTLPTGLGFGVTSDNTTCQITGTPTELISSTNITVRATNESGSNTTDLDIEVRGPPNISNQSISYPTGEEIIPERLNNTGGGATSTCEVTSGTLPTGLSISVTSDNETCEITGTPTVVTTTTVSVTATNSYGSDTADITLQITAQPIPNLSAPSELQTLVLSQSITPIELTNTGGLVTGCSVFAGTLPAGLSLGVTSDNTTCEITGTPTESMSSTSITVQAINESGNDTADLQIRVISNFGISAGSGRHTCAVDLNGVTCWGDNLYGQTDVPTLSNPTQVSAGWHHTCAVDVNGVTCWGDNEYGQIDVPTLSNPTQVTAGDEHSCTLDDNGVTCWGGNPYGQTDVPILSNPTQVSAGWNHTCAVDDNGVTCWGENDNGATDVPILSNPTQVSAGGFNCALGDNGVTCWGRNNYGQTDVPTLSNPTQVFVGNKHTCALDDNGVTCWGRNDHGESDVPTLSNPTQLALGARHTCALADNGVNCWGRNDYGETNVPTSLSFTYSPNISGVITSYPRGEEITPERLGNTGGGDIDTCEVTSGALPTGLILSITSDNETCEITGTPSVLTTNTISITATNSAGSDTADITLEITAQPIPNLSAPSELQTLILNQSISPIVLSNTGGLVTGCSVIAGTLPTGLSIDVTSDNTTCEITGTPTEVVSSTNISIQATNESGSDYANFSLSVALAAPDIEGLNSSYLRGVEVTPEQLNNSGGEIDTCEVTSGALPTGLFLGVNDDISTCEITGTPTVVTAPTTISITATNSAGSDTTDITLEITAQPIPNLSDPSEHQALNLNQLITPIEFSNSGGMVNACSIFAGTLPAGLILDVIQVGDYSTCDITGTPTEVVSSTNIAIQATNESGSDYAYLTIEVVSTSTPATHQVPYPHWLYGVLLAGLGILGVRSIFQSRA